MRADPGRHLRRAVATMGVAMVAVMLAGCGPSIHRAIDTHVSGAQTSSPPPTTAAEMAPTTTEITHATVPGQLPTAPNCGGGAYKPATLLIVCASGPRAVSATGVTWQSWGTTTAVGSGMIDVMVHGQPTPRPATLTLWGVRDGAVGPQFTQLTVTWIGPSPTGQPRASYQLQPGG